MPREGRTDGGPKSGHTGDPPAGVLTGRYRGALTGRALVGGFLVAAAAAVVFAAALAGSGSSGQPYVVAVRTLAAGSVIGPGDLTTAGMRLSGGAQSAAFRTAGPLIGRTVAVEVDSGQLLEATMLSAPGTGPTLRPVSVAVDPDSLGNLSTGERVDVLAATGSTPSSQVNVVMRGASLISVSRTSSSLLSGSSPGDLVTLGVSSLAEVEAVVQASHAGTVTLVAAEPSDGVGAGPGPSTSFGSP